MKTSSGKRRFVGALVLFNDKGGNPRDTKMADLILEISFFLNLGFEPTGQEG